MTKYAIIRKKMLALATIAALAAACSAPTQRNNDYEAFMRTHTVSWTDAFNGKSLPSFALTAHNGKEYTNNNIKGKVVLLEFWDSWNAPARFITHKLDSTLGKYRGQQFEIIGVNCQQDIQPGHLEKHWTDKGYKFPVIINADVFQQFMETGNPSIVVVDANGLVNGVWTTWSTTTIGEIEIVIASLLQDAPCSLDEAIGYFENHEYIKALYHLDGIINTYPEERQQLNRYKMRALLNIDEANALAFAKQWRTDDADSEQCLTEIATAIAEVEVSSQILNLYGAEIFQTLIDKHNKANDPSCYDQMGRCLKRAGRITQAIEAARQCFYTAYDNHITGDELALIQRKIQDYKEILEDMTPQLSGNK
ncbi:MAG: peroxiredoxin family protein [Marinifilaceae bacterium]